MATRFNPPPGWQPGEGIMPDFWVPDPSWPKAPDGWHFYVDEDGHPVDPPARAWLPPQTKATVVDAENKDFRRRKRRGWAPLWITLGVALALVGSLLYFPNVGKVTGPTAQALLEYGKGFAGVPFDKGFAVVHDAQREQLPAEYSGGKSCGPWWDDARQTVLQARRRTAEPRGDMMFYVRNSREVNERVLTSEIPCRNEMRRLWGGAPLVVEDGTEAGARFQKFTSDDDPKYQYTVVRVAYRNMVVEMNTPRGKPTVEPREFARQVVAELDKWRLWGPWEASAR